MGIMLPSRVMRLLDRVFGAPVEEEPQIVQTDSPALAGASISVAYFYPQVGGDFHDFVRAGSHRFLFGLLDVAGRRAANRAVLESVKNCFRASAEEIFSAPELNESEGMVELSRRLNLEIMKAAGGVCSCPAFAGCYNEELGTVCYVNAGHTPGLLRDQSGVTELTATGLPLGLFALAPTDARIVGVEHRGSIAIVSRGVVEAERKNSEFGLAGVKNAMQETPTTAQDLSRRILEDVQSFMHTVPKHNDVTALTMLRES
jgi:phosphoserine phosphatase RsbU/P